MGDDNVISIRDRRRPPASPPQPGDQALHRRTRQAAPGARALATEQAAAQRAGYAAAVGRQETERLLATARPVPAWISVALNVGGHEGPEVDTACGTWERNPDGDVDGWEAGTATPTAEQVKLLAKLTGFPVAFFYREFTPGPQLAGPVIVCYRTKVRGKKCHSVQPNWIDNAGVLHDGEDDPFDPAKLDAPAPAGPPVQGALF